MLLLINDTHKNNEVLKVVCVDLMRLNDQICLALYSDRELSKWLLQYRVNTVRDCLLPDSATASAAVFTSLFLVNCTNIS